MVAGAIAITCILIILFIIFRPKRSKYVRDVTSSRNSYEQGFGN